MNHILPNDPLDLAALGQGPLRRAVSFFPECESTNDQVRALAEAGEPEGALAVTDFQSAGRGRMGRAWRAPRGSSLLFSLLLRPPVEPTRALQAAMAASLGAAEGVRRACGLPARLKWPNDILIGGKKAGGMLCELGLDGESLKYVVVGIGLNVNFDPRTVEGIPPDTVSIQTELGRPQPRTALLRAILEEIEPRYAKLARGESLREEWERALETVGRRVRIVFPKGELSGVAESVDETGALVLQLFGGEKRAILAGDVVHVETADRRSTFENPAMNDGPSTIADN
jgi:BirA family biotin operon repressor/biotin-[acetyl-CoA-carboxylase] ligase